MALRGINVGGWLVAERWMTPELFEGVSGQGERAIGRELPGEEARARILAHRDSFITEEDFKWIADHGFDFIRLPFGYWLFEEAEGYVSGTRHVTHAFTWAQKHGLRVLLDFHGLQGSQNGRDHSGEEGGVRFYNSDNTNRALATIEYVARTYGASGGLLGIEVINEPKLQPHLGKLMRYYERAYATVVAHTPPDVKVIVSDGFQTDRVMRGLARHSFGDRLVVDAHLYQLFTEKEKQMGLDEHVRKVSVEWKQLLIQLGGQALIGEWTAALPGKAVEGRDVREALETYYDAQERVFNEYAWAHSYWSYRVSGSSGWSYRELPFIDGPG